MASDRVFDGILEKKRAIQARLRKRFAKALRTADWDEAELNELGETLRVMVKAHTAAKSVAQCRVDWRLPGEAA